MKADSHSSVNQNVVEKKFSVSSGIQFTTPEDEVEEIDLKFLLSFSVNINDKRPSKVLCLNRGLKCIHSDSSSMLQIVFKEIMEKKWIVLSYLSMYYLLDKFLLGNFLHKFCNIICLCLLYAQIEFVEKLEKSKRKFTTKSSFERTSSILKEFIGVDNKIFHFKDNQIHSNVFFLSSPGNPSSPVSKHNKIEDKGSPVKSQEKRSLFKWRSSTSSSSSAPAAAPQSNPPQSSNPYDMSAISRAVAQTHNLDQSKLEKDISLHQQEVFLASSGVSSVKESKENSSHLGSKRVVNPLIFTQHEVPQAIPIVNKESKDAANKTESAILKLKVENDDEGEWKVIPGESSVPSTKNETLSLPQEKEKEKLVESKSSEKSLVVSNSSKVVNPETPIKIPFDAQIFYNFEFPGLTAQARDMYRDRSYSHSFKLRGPSYFIDQVKVDPGPAMCKLMLMELYEVEKKDGDRHDHVVSRGLANKRLKLIQSLPGNPFVFVVNFQIPGDPPVSLVSYFALPPDLKDRYPGEATDRFLRLFEEFINLPSEEERLRSWGLSSSSSGGMSVFGSDNTDCASVSDASTVSDEDKSKSSSSMWGMKMPSDISWPSGAGAGEFPASDFRHARFKLVPQVTEGPWVVRAAVRAKPAMLGRKVVQRYFRGPAHFETDVHVGSSVIASQIVGLCRGYATNFAADTGIVLEGIVDEELPERLLACVGINKIDVNVRQKLD